MYLSSHINSTNSTHLYTFILKLAQILKRKLYVITKFIILVFKTSQILQSLMFFYIFKYSYMNLEVKVYHHKAIESIILFNLQKKLSDFITYRSLNVYFNFQIKLSFFMMFSLLFYFTVLSCVQQLSQRGLHTNAPLMNSTIHFWFIMLVFRIGQISPTTT